MASRPAERRHGYHPTSLEVAQRRLADATTALRVAETARVGVESAAWVSLYAGVVYVVMRVEWDHVPTGAEVAERLARELTGVLGILITPLGVIQSSGVALFDLTGWLRSHLGAAGEMIAEAFRANEKERQTRAGPAPVYRAPLWIAMLIAGLIVLAGQAVISAARVRPG